MATPVTLIKGDGIGPEVIDAAVAVLASSGVDLEWQTAEAGALANIRLGDALPDETLRLIRRTRLCLKGPLETPGSGAARSAPKALGSELELSVHLRTARSFSGLAGPYPAVDLAIIFDAADGYAAPVERFLDYEGDVVQSVTTTTRAARERLARHAFEYALKTGRNVVTLVHDANRMSMSSALFVQAGREVARHYAGRIQLEELDVKMASVQLLLNPSRFEVMVTVSPFGDILAHVAAGLVGGPELVPNMSVGDEAVIFEPTHGTAPQIAGKGIANPTAAILAGAMMLRHIGAPRAGEHIETAVRSIIEGRDRNHLPPPLGGHASTAAFGEHVANRVRALRLEAGSTR